MSLPKTAQTPSAATAYAAGQLTHNLGIPVSSCQCAQVVLSPIIDYRTSIMLVNLAIITHLCHHSGITSQGMKSVYTHFQQIPSSACLLSYVASFDRNDLIRYMKCSKKRYLDPLLGFSKKPVYLKDSLFGTKKNISPSDTAELSRTKQVSFHWHRKWVLWWVEGLLREI